MLADYLNLHIEPIIVSSVIGAVNWGHRVENGTFNDGAPTLPHHHQPKHNWTGILGILEEGIADTICTLYPYTEEKAEFFNFSHPVTGVNSSPTPKILNVFLFIRSVIFTLQNQNVKAFQWPFGTHFSHMNQNFGFCCFFPWPFNADSPPSLLIWNLD